MMKRILLTFLCGLSLMGTACAQNGKSKSGVQGAAVSSGKGKTLVVYFSWGGTTKHLAEMIAFETGADIFSIEPADPYPTAYTLCTEVAKEELDKGIYRALKTKMPSLDGYDIIFIGSPVWWHTAAMIVQGAVKDIDFSGKTVVPFCTYAATYRDETLAKIAELTPRAKHLKSYGTTSPDSASIRRWLLEIGIAK
ncbi:MAG: flavodoxin [Treponema porcinum]|uniref:flavodoxin n=1 Tax=Treponema porcinum TaxID=261392 RepID=UPI002409A919|nr:flavodoxin [Treponema porcinum]MDD6899386.1 flavodoxin [Treponema porcinum]